MLQIMLFIGGLIKPKGAALQQEILTKHICIASGLNQVLRNMTIIRMVQGGPVILSVQSSQVPNGILINPAEK